MGNIFTIVSAFLICGANFLQASEPFQSFTGKIKGNHVRMRLHPSLDGQVINELDKDDMVVVVGESEEFYAVESPDYIKGYIYRTYVVDDAIEGNRVNVRLDPHLESPIIAQMNQGDKVKGSVSPLNSKWLEIPPPSDVRFYIAKNYVEKAGGPKLLAKMEKRRHDVEHLLNSTHQNSQSEMEKPFAEINLDPIYGNYKKVIEEYQDFPLQAAKAKEYMNALQDSYLQKKVAFLESRAAGSQKSWKEESGEMSGKLEEQQQKLKMLEEQLEKARSQSASSIPSSMNNPKANIWVPVEIAMYEEWAEQNPSRSMDDFYREQSEDAVVLRGVLEPYDRAVRNKPGDYLLVNRANNLPIAYLYSTQVDLHEKLGQEVVIRGAIRPNHHFAYPAYFVLSVQ